MTPTPLTPLPLWGEGGGTREARGEGEGHSFSFLHLPPAIPLDKSVSHRVHYTHRGSEQGQGCRRCYYVV
jgi:hypothetical protein